MWHTRQADHPIWRGIRESIPERDRLPHLPSYFHTKRPLLLPSISPPRGRNPHLCHLREGLCKEAVPPSTPNRAQKRRQHLRDLWSAVQMEEISETARQRQTHILDWWSVYVYIIYPHLSASKYPSTGKYLSASKYSVTSLFHYITL